MPRRRGAVNGSPPAKLRPQPLSRPGDGHARRPPGAATRSHNAAVQSRGEPRLLHRRTPTIFELGQAWLAAPQTELRPTLVRATFVEGALHVDAEMVDDDVFNDAVRHNDRTWEMGDVFEIFARREDEERYVEVHVTPGGIKLHLRFDDFAHAQRIDGIAAVAADPDAIRAEAARIPGGWRARAVVPMPAGAGELVRVSFCRYDATRGQEPVLSSSSPHPVPAFHRPWEWMPCRIAP